MQCIQMNIIYTLPIFVCKPFPKFTNFSVIINELISIYMYINTVPCEVTVEAFGFYFLQGTRNMERNH